MILILTSPDDTHADVVSADLQRRGVALRRFDTADYPRAATLSAGFDARGLTAATLGVGGDCVRLDRLSCVWYRRPGAPVTSARLDAEGRAAVDAECAMAAIDLFDALDAHGSTRTSPRRS